MNNTLIQLMRNVSRQCLVPAIVTLTASCAIGADGAPSAPSASGSASQGSGDTTVEKELQKLFQQSGVDMPSLRRKDLPYANSPQMNRVRRIEQPQREEPPQAEPVEKKKKKNLLSRFFGRFRRQKPEAEEEVVESDPPAAVKEPRRPAGQLVVTQPPARQSRPTVAQPQGNRPQNPVQPRRPNGQVSAVPVSRPAVNTTQTAPGPQRPVQRSAQQPRVQTQTQPRPQAQAQARVQPQAQPSSSRTREVPRLDFTTEVDDVADEFLDPFDDAASSSDNDALDLDAIAEIPQATAVEDVATAMIESAADDVQELAEEAPIANPFTGLTLSEDDEWTNPEQSTVTADDKPASDSVAADEIDLSSNPFFLAEQKQKKSESAPADSSTDRRKTRSVRIAPRVVRPDPAAEIKERIVPAPEANPFADSDSAEPSEDGSADQWRARLTSNGSPRPATTTASSRRLATTDRVPASRTQARRWRASASSESTASGKSPEFSDGLDETPADDSSDLSPQEARRRQIEERRHLDGFMGFCPVTLREKRDLVDASDQYQADFGLQTYQFSSADALAKFEASPARYAPVAGGADVVALVNSGEHHPGSLRFAMWYRDRLYLFQSRETMGLFRENPARFADKY